MNSIKTECKVLYIVLEYGKTVAGGVGRVINGLIANLGNRLNYSVFYLKFNIFRKDWDVYLYQLEGSELKLKQHAYNYQLFLKTLISAEKYDIVHLLYTGEHSSKCMNVIKTHFPRVKVVYSCHSIAKYEQNIRKSSLRSIIFEEDIVSQADHFHFLNTTSLNYFNSAYPGITDRISSSIIPNGIDEHEYRLTAPGWIKKMKKKTGDNTIIISCLSRWSYGKGLEYLLDAVPRVIKYNKNVRVIIAGRKLISWENGYQRYLMFINKKLAALKGYVFPLGWADNIKRNSIYAMTDIYVMPSLLEYYPYAMLEPMISRLPIISARIDAVTELINENEDCLLYEPTNAGELAEKIIYLSSRPDLRERLGHNAYQKIKSLNTWDSIVQDYIRMYQEVLTHSPAQQAGNSSSTAQLTVHS